MADIRQIALRIVTSDIRGAGTDDNIYFGIAGREFYVDSSADDFESGSDRIYLYGESSNIRPPLGPFNHPQGPPLDTADVDAFPAYLRVESPIARVHESDDIDVGPFWAVKLITATVNPGAGEIVLSRSFSTEEGLGLGSNVGRYVYLRRESAGPVVAANQRITGEIRLSF